MTTPDTSSESAEPQANANAPQPVVNDLQKYRCLIGHLICESLGYFTPRSALNAILAHREQKHFACEWYSHAASGRGKGMFDQDALIEVNRSAIEGAYRSRHNHTGCMAHYPKAKAIVQHEIEGNESVKLASWF